MNTRNIVITGVTIILVIVYIILTIESEPMHEQELYHCTKISMGTSSVMCSNTVMVE